MIVYAAKTDVGKVRELNQDFFIASETRPQLFILCDGMGGHKSGDVASRTAAESIETYVRLQNALDYDAAKAAKVLRNAVSYANKIVYARAMEENAFSGMGTTADVCMIDFDAAYIAHVGDSRVYHLSDGVLSCLTKDHSLVSEMVDQGVITEDEARMHPKKNVITRAVGTNQSVEADFISVALKKNDMLLMCSDGLSNMLSDSEIQNILQSDAAPAEIVETLVREANEKGGNDNITVVLINKLLKEEA